MGVFGGIKGAKYSEGGNYVKPGVHRFKVMLCKHIKTAPHTGSKDAFVVEMETLESTAHEKGELVTWMATLDKTPSLGNIKMFLMAALPAEDVTEDQIDESVVEYAINEAENPLKDQIVRCSATNIKTKANRDFTKCKFIRDSAGAEAAAAA